MVVQWTINKTNMMCLSTEKSWEWCGTPEVFPLPRAPRPGQATIVVLQLMEWT